MLFSFILALGLYHLISFLFRLRERSLLYFSLFVFIVMLRIISTGTLLATDILGFSWLMNIRLEYFTFAVISVPIVLYLYGLYKNDIHKVILVLWVVEGIVYGIITLAASPTFFTSLRFAHQIVCLSEVGYIAFLMIRLVHKKEPEARVIAAGFSALLFTAILDILTGMKIIHLPNMLPVGLLFFLLVQAVSFARTFNSEKRQSDLMKDELLVATEQRNRFLDEIKKVIADLTHEDAA